MRRKNHVFNVIGYSEVGMGHIYRSLSLCHEISDHLIEFVCTESSRIAVEQLTGLEYIVHSCSDEDLVETIINLKPDIVINDVLDTSDEYMSALQGNGFKIVNFEDLERAQKANLVFNELYDDPQIDGTNFVWGHNYYFLRDEFSDAKPRAFRETVDRILITFGGTDPKSALTLSTIQSIVGLQIKYGFEVEVVSGAGYSHKDDLIEYIKHLDCKIRFTWATGVMSHIMESCDLAICSNGRTVYELAHMNIPSIVLSQRARYSQVF